MTKMMSDADAVESAREIVDEIVKNIAFDCGHLEGECPEPLCVHWQSKQVCRIAAALSQVAAEIAEKEKEIKQLHTALADQRRQLGADYDKLNDELGRVRKVAYDEIESLRANHARSYCAKCQEKINADR